jgi:hypothetical protein
MARTEGGSGALAGSAVAAVRSDTAHVPLMRLAELAAEGRPSHVDGARRAAFGDLSASVGREVGPVEGIASEQMVLALIAVASFPTAFPRWTSIITGSDTTSEDFRSRHRAAVDAIAERLTGRARSGLSNGSSMATSRTASPATVDLTSGIDLTAAESSTAPLSGSTQHVVERAAAIAEEEGASEISPAHLFSALRAMAPEVVVRANASTNGE